RRHAQGGGDVADVDGGRAADAAGVVVGDGGGDGDRVRRRAVAGGQAVVLVDVAGAEAGHPRRQRQGGVGRAVAPGDHHRVPVLHADVGDRTAERGRVALAQRRQARRHRHRRRHVDDGNGGRTTGGTGVVVGDRRRDGGGVRRRAVARGTAVIDVD